MKFCVLVPTRHITQERRDDFLEMHLSIKLWLDLIKSYIYICPFWLELNTKMNIDIHKLKFFKFCKRSLNKEL